MGRTVLPFSQVLAEHQRQYSKFRRALRAEDQQALDALFEQARLHIQAAVYYADPEPAESANGFDKARYAAPVWIAGGCT